MRTHLMSVIRNLMIIGLLVTLIFGSVGVAPAYAWGGTGHFVLESIGYTDGTHARAYTAAPNFRQASTSVGQANSLISSADEADVYVNFDFDTTGRNVQVVYTTDGSAPTKSNGLVVNAAFSKYAEPNRTWYATLPAQTSGTTVKYAFYISDSDLSSAWGRVSGTSANRDVSQYELTWAESDGAYFTYIVAYPVSYDANGADSGIVPGDQTKTHAVDLTLATNSGNLVRTGYTFIGWNTQASGLGTHYAEAGIYTTNAAVTLYAEWTLNTYTVTYNVNGATSGTAPNNQVKVYGIDLTLAANSGSLVRTGYTFTGWNTATDGTGTHYDVSATYTANAAVTLYAQWALNHTVTFNGNGSTGGAMTAQITGVPTALKSNSFLRTGYTFTGWNTVSNGSGTAYANGAIYDFSANLTLYAQWTVTTYPVTYNANNAASGTAPGSQTKTYDVNLTLASNSGNLTRTNFIFNGWNIAANGLSTHYAEAATYSTNAVLTLYAEWACTPSPVVISTADSGDGTLREAVTAACVGGTITFDSSLAGQTITLTSGEIALTKNLTIDGSGLAAQVTLSGNGAARVFNISTTGKTVVLKNLTIANGTNGVYDNGSTLMVTASNFNYNVGPAIYLNSIGSTLNVSYTNFDHNTGGAAIASNLGNVNVDHSSFSNNSGAINSFFGNAYTITVANSSFYSNTAASGGAIYVRTNLIVKNSVFSNNKATTSGSDIYSFSNCGTAPNDCKIQLGNNIFANPVTSGSFFNNAGTWIDLGHNISDQNSGGVLNSATSKNNTNARLGAFGNYGGSTATFPLLPGSPAIDAGDDILCAALSGGNVDQRDEARVGVCDIGSFESQGFTLALESGSPQATVFSTAFSNPLVVNVAPINPVEPVSGGRVTFTAPGSGASATFTGNPATISSASASVTATANSTVGAYTVTANASGASGGADFLLTNTYALHTVTFEGNGSTGGSLSPQTNNLPTALTSNAFTRIGYTFAGWNTAANGSGTAYADGATYSFAANVTLYAQWTINTYAVSYDANGADSGTAPGDQTKTYAVDLTLATNSGSLVKTGYTFTGWNTQADGLGTHYDAGATYTANAAATLYAAWTINTYPVSYDGNGADSGTAPDGQTKTQDVDLTLATNSGNLARTNYTFTGWNTQADGLGMHYAAAGTYTANAAVTLYAEWTINTYPASYDGNGNTDGTVPSNQTKTHDVDLTLATNSGSLVKTGYTFTGWNTQADGLGTHYDAGAIYTANAAIALYAEWTINTVTFDANGGIGTMAPQVSSVPAALNTNTFTRVNYTFAGWNTTANGSGTAYADGATYNFSAHITLYAQWACASSLVVTTSADSGAGSLRQAIADVCSGGTITFNDNYTITLASRLVIGKNVTINGTGRSVTISGGNAVQVMYVNSGTTVTLNALTIANARNTNTICNSTGDGGGICNDGGTLTIMNSTFSSNYASMSGGAIYQRAGTLTVSNSTFSGNSVTSYYGGAINIQAGTVNVTNSTFSGNSTPAANRGGGIYRNTGSTLNLYNTIIANSTNGDCVGAVATSKNNLISNTGTQACGLVNGTNSNIIGFSPLLGVLGDNGGSTQTFALQAGSPAIGAGDTATCAAAPINNLDQRGAARPQGTGCDMGAYELIAVNYHGNANTGGTVPSAQAKNYDINLTLATNSGALARIGYTFTGWNTQANGLGTRYNVGATYTANVSVTLYAEWTLNTYPVSYDGNGNTDGTVPADQTKTQDVDLTLATNSGALVKTGYTFTGWNTQADGLGTHYNAGATYTANAIVTLYAEWTINTYPVNYDGNGNTDGTAPSDQTKTYAVDLTLATNSGALVKTGYTFAGWNTQADGLGTHYDAGATYTTNAAITLYAQWTINTYTITAIADANGSITPSGAQTMNYGDDITFTIAADTGYHIADVDVDGVSQGPIGSYTFNDVTANHTLAATFAADSCSNPSVTSDADGGPGSLRYAIACAAPGDTITFNGDMTITLASELAIGKDLALDGETHQIVVSGNDVTRVFNVTAGNVTFTHLIIADGNVQTVDCGPFDATSQCGGGIMVQDSSVAVTVANSILIRNTASQGGGLYNLGTLTVTDSTFVSNIATMGGGLLNDSGTLTVRDSVLVQNSAGWGGGIENYSGILSVSSTTFDRNVAANYGGGINLDGSAILTVTNSAFTGNSITNNGGGGGGISGGGASMTVVNSIFTSNTATYGGGFFNNSSTVTVTNSTFTDNSATSSGGGVYVQNRTATFENSTFSGNNATGSGSAVTAGGLGSPSCWTGNIVLKNATIAGGAGGNSAVRAIAPQCGIPTTLTLSNSIVSRGIETNAFNVAAGSIINDGGHNLTNDGSGPNTPAGIAVYADLGLGSLGNYGGATPTIPLLSGSPAIDAGDNAICPATDQRGVIRPQGAHCDSGAYELETPATTTDAATSVTANGATLNGTVNANNASAVVTFEYGLTASYGSSVTATPSPVTGGSDTAVSAALTGLMPNTTYHYRVVGVNGAGTTNGSDQTFTTSALVPAVTTEAATNVTLSGATLNGTVNANNASTTVTFEYGLTTSYGSSVTATPSPVTGGSDTAVSAALMGLTPNTTYHYRVVGVNLAGTTHGSDQTFMASLATGTFRNITEPGWTFYGTACLTAGSACASGTPVNEGNGNGWLRLTSATNAQSGSALFNTAFSSTAGLQATFTYATYGGNGADGITFYLIDGATLTPTLGAAGGALGYSWAADYAQPGVTNGYVGIGLDELGNFSHAGFGACNPSCPTVTGSSIAVRGSGSSGSLSAGFNFLTRVDYPVSTGSRAGAKRVRIIITPGTPILTVQVDSGSGFVTQISNLNLTTAVGQGAIPATFKLGLSAGTGNANNYHEIRDLTIIENIPSSTSLSTSGTPSTAGSSVTFTATVTGASGTPTGVVTFMDGATTLVTGTLDGSGQATLSTAALAVGAHALTARYEGDNRYAPSVSSMLTQTVNSSPTATTNAATSVTASGATLNGTVNANGASTTVTFEYGLTASYGSSVTPTPSPVTGGSDTVVSAVLTSLAPNTTYHYRVIAVNGVGTTNGSDQIFTTSALALTVTFDGNGGGTPSPLTKTVTFNSAYGPLATVSHTGYIFNGWYTAASGGSLVTSATIVVAVADHTLYAQWTPNTYTVTFHANGGSGAMSDQSGDYNTTAALTANAFTKTGYTFSGWDTNSAGATVVYADGANYTFPVANADLYAVWTINQYTLAFDSNGGSAVTSLTQNYGTAVSAPTAPTKAGSIFVGWYTDNVTFLNAYTFSTMPAANTTVYAKWTVQQYTISFNSNGGSAVSSITQDFGTVVTAPANPTRDGYTFAGWYSDAGLTTLYTFNRMPAANTTLYAKWNSNGCVVANNLDSGDGSLRQTLVTCPSGGTISFDSSLSGATIPLASTLVINKHITIDGSALATAVRITGGHQFTINAGFTVRFTALRISNATATAVTNLGDFTVTDSTFDNNNSGQSGGAIQHYGGTLAVANSTFMGNQASLTGGAIYAGKPANITNSTFYGNRGRDGGGISIYNSSVVIRNSTFLNNSVSRYGKDFYGGGGIPTLYNTIANCGATAIDGGNNIDLGTSCGYTAANGSRSQTDPLLGAPANNGGRTQTMALLAGSPALNAGNDSVCTASPVSGKDQRGLARPQGAHCDIGSYEAEAPTSGSGTVTLGKPIVTTSANGTTVTVFDHGEGAAPGYTTINIYDTPPSGVATLPDQLGFWVDVTPTTNTGLDAALKVCYNPNAIPVGVNETTLVFYHNDGSGWVRMVTVVDTVNHCATVFATRLDLWALAPDAAPAVTGITRLDPGFTNASSVNFRAAFSQIVNNVSADDFTAVASGSLSGVSVASVTPDPVNRSVYTVTVNVGAGLGSVRLDLNNSTNIQSIFSIPVSGGYTGGESYTMARVVTFDGNGADGGEMPSQISDVAAILAANTFTRTGYTFAGWNTAANGSGDSYADEAEYNFLTDITFYAQWTPDTYTVTFHANGGSGTMSNQSGDYNTTATLTANSFTKTGYTFNGWNTAVNGSGTAYANGADYTFIANITLYAQWVANSYTVTFDGDGGDIPSPITKMVTFDSAYGTLATASRTGYAFNGWYTAASGGSLVTMDTIVATTADHTLYAQWTPNTYTVTFAGNGGGTPAPITQTVTFESAYSTLATVGRAGYTFNGWYTAGSGGSLVTAATTVTTAADHTLYAQWTPSTYTVTFDGNGGSTPAPIIQTVTFDSAYGILATVSNTGYMFNGWYTAASGGFLVTSATTITTAADHTLYAQWTLNQYTLSFDSNGGSAVPYITQNYGTAVSAPTAPSKAGYIFVDWYTDNGTFLNAYTFSTMSAANTIVYAKWTAQQYTLSFNSNGGSTVSAITQDVGTVVTAPADPTRDGYTFAGWYSDADLTTLYTFNRMPAANTTLYAKWNGSPCVVGGGAGSLAEALINCPTGGTITFNGDYVININISGGLIITKDITIDGTGHNITIKGVSLFTGSGQGRRVFYIDHATVTLNHLTIANGGCYLCFGAGIYNAGGTLTIMNSVFSQNWAGQFSGAIHNDGGLLAITNSTFSDNYAQVGGAISNYGRATIINSTFTGNSTQVNGAIYNRGTLTVTNSTFAGNKGGGSIKGGTLYLRNNIFADNAGGDCPSTPQVSINNLVKNGSCAVGFVTGDPKLGVLQNNGGPAQTMALLTGSAAVDAGDDATCTAADQRGLSRSQGARCDIGAYEVEIPASTSGTVTLGQPLTANSSNGTSVSVTDNGGASLGNTTVTIYTAPPKGVTPLPNQTAFWVDVTPTTNTGLNATLKVCYDPNRIPVGVNEANLVFYSHEGQGWVKLKTTIDTVNHCATVNTTHFSVWNGALDAAPEVSEITRLDADLTNASSVNFRVAFSQIVINVSADDFTTVITDSLSGVAVAAVTPDPIDQSVYTVTVNVGAGLGTVRLDLNSSTDIQATDADSTPISGGYTDGDSYTMARVATFDGNGADGGESLPQVSTAADLLAANTFTRTGYTFAGWNTMANGSGDSYADQAEYNFLADITLYAQWACSSSLVVTTNADSGANSLRQAIADACAGSTITFNGDMTVTLTSELAIGKSLTFDGETHAVTVSGSNATRVFNVTAGNITFAHLTIANGNVTTGNGGGIMVQNSGVAVTVTNSTLLSNIASFGGGLYNASGTVTVLTSTLSGNTAGTGLGGGVYNGGLLTVRDSVFVQNTTPFRGGGIENFGGGTLTVSNTTFDRNVADWGGGLNNDGVLTVTNSTFTGNSATSGGGGISGGGSTLAIVNSTFDGNTAGGNGGGAIFNNNANPLRIINSTLQGNTASASGGGGGIRNTVTPATNLYLDNTILAGNKANGTASDCVSASTLGSGQNNLIQDAATACGLSNGVNGNLIGVDPQLATLANNGGRTQTMALLVDSSAIDAGDAAICAAAPVSSLDQRGMTRDDLQCDIGAYELKYASSLTIIRSASATTMTTFGPALLGIQRSSVVDPGVITATKSLAWKTKPANAIDAYWSITPTLDTGLNLTLTLCYPPSESNSLNLSDLRFWKFNAGAWSAVAGTPVTSTVSGNLCATVAGINELSVWTLGTTDQPTAVIVRAFTAQSTASAVLPWLALIGTVSGFVATWRKRQSRAQ